MGRISRQRKFKACDPFSKERKPVKGEIDSFDRPPKKQDDGHFSETKSLAKFQKKIAMVKDGKIKKKKKKNLDIQEPRKKTKKGAKNQSVKEALNNTQPKQANETQKQYFQRLNDNIQNAAMEAIKDGKKLRKKRKEHLKIRDEKRKTKQYQTEEEQKDFNSFKDNIKFGEVVQEPPTINFKPRKAEGKKNRTLHLTSLVQEKNESSKKKREPMSEDQIAERQRAIDAYRLLKKRKEMMRDMS